MAPVTRSQTLDRLGEDFHACTRCGSIVKQIEANSSLFASDVFKCANCLNDAALREKLEREFFKVDSFLAAFRVHEERLMSYVDRLTDGLLEIFEDNEASSVLPEDGFIFFSSLRGDFRRDHQEYLSHYKEISSSLAESPFITKTRRSYAERLAELRSELTKNSEDIESLKADIGVESGKIIRELNSKFIYMSSRFNENSSRIGEAFAQLTDVKEMISGAQHDSPLFANLSERVEDLAKVVTKKSEDIESMRIIWNMYG